MTAKADLEQLYRRGEEIVIRLVAQNKAGNEDESRKTFDELLNFLIESNNKDLVRYLNGFLYLGLDKPLPLPPRWQVFVSTYGGDFAEQLAREGIAAIKLCIMEQVERDPMGTAAALRRAGLLRGPFG